MNNTSGTADVALSVFGGAVPEMSPEDLPEGASPFNQDVDYSPGTVGSRGGRQNQVSFAGLFSEKLAGIGQTLPGAHVPNEQAWIAPNNATLNTPGTYASVNLNVVSGSSGGSDLDHASQATGITQSIVISDTPSAAPELAILFPSSGGGTIGGPGGGWIQPVVNPIWYQLLSNTNTVNAVQAISGGVNKPWAQVLAFIGSNGATPAWTFRGNAAQPTGNITAAPFTPTAGESIIFFLQLIQNSITVLSATTWTVTDSAGNVYQRLGNPMSGAGNTIGAQSIAFMASNVPAVPTTITATLVGGTGNFVNVNYYISSVTNLVTFSSTPSYSQNLDLTNFGFSIPATNAITGLQVEVFGHQSTLSSDAILTANLLLPGGQISLRNITGQLLLADGLTTLGLPVEGWTVPLTPTLLNNPAFGVQIVASAIGGELANFAIYAVKLKAWLTPNPPSNFNWIKTYEQTDGEVDTLALDANGVLWDEDVDTAPGVLNGISTAINPGSYVKSVTFDDVEYMAFSDLSNGTDIPRLWNGQWLDRVSQVGPGAPPSVALTASGSAITSITQNAAIAMPSGGAHNWLLVSAGPSAHGTIGTPATPGNVMSLFLSSDAADPIPARRIIPPSYIKVGSNIQILGFPSINGQNVNNDPAGVFNPAFYTVASVGQAIPGQASFAWITFQVPFTTFYNQQTPLGCTVQATLSTLTAAQQVPYLEVGNQFTVAGGTLAGYDNTFVVQATPNAAQLQITQTSLTSNVAQYVFTLITGSAPVVGQFVTVTGTLNGNGVFNVVNAVITAATPTTFSISLVSPSNINASPETGNGIISGTIFQFDPAGVVTNPIVGNATGGTISTSGVLGVGQRSAVCIFQTRNAALTAPSPPVQFNITVTASAIVASQIPIGPPDVTARIIAFTGANGGNYFYIPQPVTVTSNGQQVTYTSTVVNDNTTTQATFSFPDAVLLAASPIDVQGNNLFEQIELGSSVGFLSYASRVIAWGEQNKIQNLLNLSFDGGVGVATSNVTAQNAGVNATYPLGWTVDPTNGGGGSLIVSPIFGNSYYIKNATGGLQATYGMIEQGAFQDQFQVPIVTTNTQYSVRVTARCPSQIGSGNLVMDLFSPKLNQVFGSFSVPLASMGSTMKIISGTMLTTAFQVVPKDLLFRVYATALPNNGDVELDRVEPFPTAQPVFSTQFRASYADNPEAFDLVTGGFGPNQNQQPIRGGMQLFDTLYALKTKSWFSTSDNGTTEPNFWQWREVSNKVGTIGSHSYDYGEEWAFTACRAGVYFFNGGEPLRVSQEIAPVWDLVNWAAGQSIWVRNDTEQRKLYVGVPIATPNIFMPEFPVNSNPQTPNVVLMMSYRELNSGIAIADTPPIRSSFSGRLLAPEPARKWSFWNIASPYADFIDRGNNTTPLWLCSGYANSKLYQLLDSAADDDGAALNSFYLTHGVTNSDMQEAKGLGLHRMLLAYITLLSQGAGTMNVYVYPQSPQNLPYTLAPIPLPQFSFGDLEAVVNITAERFFLRVGTNAVGAKFQLSKAIFSLSKDMWSSIRGTQVGAA